MGYNVSVSVTGNTAHHKRKCQRLQWYSSTETGGDKSAFKVNYYYYNFFFFFGNFFVGLIPLVPESQVGVHGRVFFTTSVRLLNLS